MFKVLAETRIEHPTIKCSPNGLSCVVFNEGVIHCYRLLNKANLLWSRSDMTVVDCVFVGERKLLVSTRDDPPMVVGVDDGEDAGRIEPPVRTTLRTRYGELYSHSNGRIFLRTSCPFELVELDPQTFSAEKSLSAESVSNVVFHPEQLMFAGVVDAAAQEVIIGTFESTPYFCESSLYLLPYVYALGLSRSGRWLHVLGSDGEQTKLVAVDMGEGEVVRTRALDLALEQSVSLPGNEDGVFVTPKILPVVGETRALVFQCGGEAIIVSAVEGMEERLRNAHNQVVCSTSQAVRGDMILSADWDGNLAKWELETVIVAETCQTWSFIEKGQGVAGSYEAKPVRLM